MFTVEQQMRLAQIRQRNLEGTATDKDFQEFVLITREGRMSAAASSDTAKKKAAKAAIPNGDDLLDSLF